MPSSSPRVILFWVWGEGAVNDALIISRTENIARERKDATRLTVNVCTKAVQGVFLVRPIISVVEISSGVLLRVTACRVIM